MGRGFATTVVLLAATVLATGCSASTEPALAAFDRPATGEDEIPEGVQLAHEYEQIRFIGEAGDAMVYAAQGSVDEPWCVVVALTHSVDDGDWAVGSSCTGDSHFAERGVWAGVRGPNGQDGAALLLPDDFDGEVGPGWQVVEPNLAVRR